MINVIQRKELRGKLVALLYEQQGRWTQVSSLINAFARSVVAADTEVPNQLYYLADEDKRYIKIQCEEGGTPELTPMREAYVRLTATGCNLMEGDVDDPGVIFGEGRRC